MPVPELPPFNVHRAFRQAIKKPIWSVADAVKVLERDNGRSTDPFFEGRKWAALRFLHNSDEPAAEESLVRFADVTVTIPSITSTKKLRNDPSAIAHRPADAKRPYYETFRASGGPEVSGGATEMGRGRRG